MSFEESKNNDPSPDIAPEKFPQFEEIVDKAEVDRKGQEFAERMGEQAKAYIRAWLDKNFVTISGVQPSEIEKEKVVHAIASLTENMVEFYQVASPVSREASEYFTERVDIPVYEKWMELVTAALVRNKSEEFQGAPAAISEWWEGIKEKKDIFEDEWFSQFSKKVSDSVAAYIKELTEKNDS
jgi:hypothetical protein